MRRSICLILLIALLTAGCLGCVPRRLENNAEIWMQQVLEAIAAEDCEILVSLFGAGLADETDAQVLFDFIQGQIQTMELTEGPSYLSTHGGLYRQWDIGCDLTTSAGAYRIAIRVTGMETDMALQSLYIIRAEDIDPETGYWGGIVFTPGITIAGIQ